MEHWRKIPKAQNPIVGEWRDMDVALRMAVRPISLQAGKKIEDPFRNLSKDKLETRTKPSSFSSDWLCQRGEFAMIRQGS